MTRGYELDVSVVACFLQEFGLGCFEGGLSWINEAAWELEKDLLWSGSELFHEDDCLLLGYCEDAHDVAIVCDVVNGFFSVWEAEGFADDAAIANAHGYFTKFFPRS